MMTTRTLQHTLYKTAALALTMLCLLTAKANAQGVPFIRNFTAATYQGHNQNFDIITGDDGTIYVANFEGLLYYDQARWHMLHTSGITRITSVFRDSKGRIWTGGYNYFGFVEKRENGRLHLKSLNYQKNADNEVLWIWEREGRICFLASDDNIYQVNNDKITLAPGMSLPKQGKSVLSTTHNINQVQKLDFGLKALATTGQGIIITNAEGKQLMNITIDNGLCSNNVSHITYDGHGVLWGATDNGIFAMAVPSVYSRLTTHEGLQGEVLAIEKLDGQVFVGTLSGLYRVKDHHCTPVGGISYACWQLTRQGNRLLAATANGVYTITADGATKQLTTTGALSILVVADGIYIGEMDGLYHINAQGRKVKLHEMEKPTRIVRDAQGYIWVQNLYGNVWCNHGDNRFEPYKKDGRDNEAMTLLCTNGRVQTISVSDTKPFPYPLYYYAEPNGLLWLTDNKGKHLYAFKNDARQAAQSETVIPLQDYSMRAMMRDGNHLWIGGDRGIVVLNSDYKDPMQHAKPKLLIRTIRLGNDSVLWGGHGQLPQQLPRQDGKERHLSIDFALNYPGIIGKVYYRYRINGGQWSTWDVDTNAELFNQPYGENVFEVQARDAWGRQSEIVRIEFSYAYPWYMQWYMLTLYMLLAILAILGISQWRLNRVEKEKNRLETIVRERTAEVVRLEKMATTGKLTQGLIDRILNPLNYINNFAKLSQGLINDVTANIEDEKEHMDADNYEDTADILDMLKGNLQKVSEHGASTTRILKAMEEMMKDRSGGIVRMNLTTLLHQNEEMVRKYYEKEIGEHHIHCVFQLPQNDIFVNGNAEQLSKTFMSMLGNAVYAVSKKTQRPHDADYVPEIAMKATTMNGGKQIVLHIHDNGTGIEKTIISKVFDPFFTTKTTAEATGIGLYLCQEIVQNCGGTISVDSEKNVFTEFTITLPTIA